MLKRLAALAVLLALSMVPGLAIAAPSSVSYSVGVCDPDFPQKCVKPVADGSAAISISTATTTKLITGDAVKRTGITHYNVIAGGTGNITLVYGTGGTCGTGQVALTGAYNLTAQVGLVAGNGSAAMVTVPAGNDICAVTSAAVQMSGLISFNRFK